MPPRRGLFPADALATALVLEPDFVRQVETRYVQVELAGQYTPGFTVVEPGQSDDKNASTASAR
jgi:inosine-uridine nucleoside N-ribohydrolase